MKFLTRFLFVVAVVLFGVLDQPQRSTAEAFYTEIGTISNAKTSPTLLNWGAWKAVSFCGYYTCNDGGGGFFVQVAGPCVDDGGSFLKDRASYPTGGNCYKRVDLADVNGLADVLKFGCKADAPNGVSISGWDNKACFNATQTAAIANNLAGVNMCGNSTGGQWFVSAGWVYTTSWVCHAGDQNRAEGTANPGTPVTGDYTHYPYTIFTPGPIHCGIVAVSHGSMSGVNILRAGINVNGGAPQNTQDLDANVAAETGSALNFDSDGCSFEHGNIFGFGTGLTVANIREMNFQHVKMDCTVKCLNFVNKRGGGKYSVVDVQFGGYLTGVTAFSVQRIPLASSNSITSSFAVNGQHNLMVTLAAPCPSPGNCPQNGTYMHITAPGGAQSSTGQGFFVDMGNDTTQWILRGSSDAYLTGQNMQVSFNANSDAITIIGATPSQLQNYQNITSSVLCPDGVTPAIPVGSQVAAVWRVYNGVDYHHFRIDSTPGVPAYTNCAKTNVTVTVTDDAVAQSLSAVQVGSSGGTKYTLADEDVELTPDLSGAVCDPNNLPQFHISQMNHGVVQRLAVDQVGSCTVFPNTVNNVPTGATTGTGLTTTLFHRGAMYLYPSQRHATSVYIGNILSVTLTDIFTIDYDLGVQCDGCAGVKLDNYLDYTTQEMQDNNICGVELTGNAQGFSIVGASVHAYACNIVDQACAGSQIGPNDINGVDVGGNNNLSGPNQVMFYDENCLANINHLDGNGNPAPINANSKLVIRGSGSTSRGYAFVADDISPNSLLLTDNHMESVNVMCEKPTTFKNIISDLTNIFDSNSCPVIGPPNVNLGIINPTTPYVMTPSLCGKEIGGGTYVKLPDPPPTGCDVTFRIGNNARTIIDPGSQTILSPLVGAVGPFEIDPRPVIGYLTLEFDNADWFPKSGSPGLLADTGLALAPNSTAFQIQFSSDLTNSRVRACPFNGAGWFPNSGHSAWLPGCAYSSASNSTGANRLDYYYLTIGQPAITAAQNDGSGHIQVTLSGTTGTENGDPIVIQGVGGTLEANGTFTLANLNTGTGTATLVNMDGSPTTFVNAFTAPGNGRAYLLRPFTGAPALTNGVQVLSGSPQDTFVGEAYLNGSQLFSDDITHRNVASYPWPQLKTCFIQTGSDQSTASATLAELNTSNRCEFVSIVTTGDSRPVEWSFGGAATSDTNGDGFNAAMNFDDSGTPLFADLGSPTVATAAQRVGFSRSGRWAGVTDGHHYGSLYGQRVTGGNAKFLSGWTQEIGVMQ